MVRVPTSRIPTHPGEMLLEEFLVPMKLSQRELATGIHVPYQRINDIINGRRGITLCRTLCAWLNSRHVSGFLDEPATAPGSILRSTR